MASVTFVFICQEVDLKHPTQATAAKWIEAFAKNPYVKEMIVISLRTGEFSLPNNVTVYSFQRNNRLITLFRFYSIILKIIVHKKIDFFWINQGGPYPLLLLPFKILMRKPVYQWKAHPYINWQMRFYARYCDTKIFTCTANSFPMDIPKVRVVGHGIDVEKFNIFPTKKIGDLVTTGRITPSKHLETMLRMLDVCNRHYGTAYRLDIYGAEDDRVPEYRKQLETLIQALNLSRQVSFKGAVKHADLPAILNTYRVFLNFSETALDKAVVEAMACGLPVMSTNVCVADILPPDLQSLLFVHTDNLEQIGKSLHELLSQDETSLTRIGIALREIAVQQHSVERLIEKVLTEVCES